MISDPKARWLDVTPEMVRRWLRLQEGETPGGIVGQRKIKPTVVNRYADDLIHGWWLQNPQPILLDTAGDPIDGQHRLLAILKSGVTVRMLIVEGVDPAVRLVIDTGSPRSAYDAATVMGFGYTRRVCQMSNFIMTKRVGRRPSHAELMEFVGVHRRALEWADGHASKDQRLAQIPVITVFARAMYRPGATEKLEQFLEVLDSGIPDTEEDKTVLPLRNWLLRPEKHQRKMIYNKTEFVVDGYLVGNKLKKVYEATEELFPLPEEKDTAPR